MAAGTQFAMVYDEDISEMKIGALPKATQNATKYGVELFKGM